MPPFSLTVTLCAAGCFAAQGTGMPTDVTVLHIGLCSGGSFVRLVPRDPRPEQGDDRKAGGGCHGGLMPERRRLLSARCG